jgi:hypothetical protein
MKYLLIAAMMAGALTGCPEAPVKSKSGDLPTLARCVILLDWSQEEPTWWTGVEEGGLYKRCDSFLAWSPSEDASCGPETGEAGEPLLVPVRITPGGVLMHSVVEDKCIGPVVSMKCTNRNCKNAFGSLDLKYRCSTALSDRRDGSCLTMWKSN